MNHVSMFDVGEKLSQMVYLDGQLVSMCQAAVAGDNGFVVVYVFPDKSDYPHTPSSLEMHMFGGKVEILKKEDAYDAPLFDAKEAIKTHPLYISANGTLGNRYSKE